MRVEPLNAPTVPFPPHFPTNTFRITTDLYLQECRSNRGLGGISALARSCRLMYHLLEPEVFRFVPTNTVQTFIADAQTLKTARQYTKVLDASTVVNPDYRTSPAIGPITTYPWLMFLGGYLEKLCLPTEYIFPFTPDPIYVRDFTLVSNGLLLAIIRCKRFHSILNQTYHPSGAAVVTVPFTFNSLQWILEQRQVTSFAFDLATSHSNRVALSTIFHLYSQVQFESLQESLAIVWFPVQALLEKFRHDSRMLAFEQPRDLHIVYLLLEKYEQWMFGALEWRGEDKIQSIFE